MGTQKDNLLTRTSEFIQSGAPMRSRHSVSHSNRQPMEFAPKRIAPVTGELFMERFISTWQFIQETTNQQPLDLLVNAATYHSSQSICLTDHHYKTIRLST
ncbi:hypothetical protein NPIL_175541 [Nephila pilipes]|uniref:Uncharacterized protein n=1 Tax=Nephila pilipes TaxID=299642 RepID=A0A8X6MMW8_NEPPI|nr:hypothetical protein NPIL_175541 [Nephila pilipes]